MKITNVRIFADRISDPIVLSFRDPSSQLPYTVKSIRGLDADDINRRFYTSAIEGTTLEELGSDPVLFHELFLDQRQLVVFVGLNPDWEDEETYSDLRDRLYKMIASSRSGKLKLQFFDGETGKAQIEGYISKFEAGLFSRSPEVQFTIDCPDPFLRGINPVTWVRTEQMPVQNANGYTVIDDVSTAPHGMTIKISCQGALQYIDVKGGHRTAEGADLELILPGSEGWDFQIKRFGSEDLFTTDDEVIIQNEFKGKVVSRKRGINLLYLADRLSRRSLWPMMFPGENKYWIRDHNSRTYPTLAWCRFETVTYRHAFWGI